MSKNTLKRLFALLVLVLAVAIPGIACGDDDSDNIPDTGVAGADAVIEDTADAVDAGGNLLNTAWCLGSVNDWEVKCGGDGIKPAD